jgi:hypothetical protein
MAWPLGAGRLTVSLQPRSRLMSGGDVRLRPGDRVDNKVADPIDVNG